MLHFVLIAVTFIIAALGWFKGDKPSKLVSMLIVALLMISALSQVWQVKEESSARENLETNLVAVQSANDSLLQLNNLLLIQNEDLADRIASYQDELERQHEAVEGLRLYGKIAKMGPEGKDIPIGFGLKYSTAISRIMTDALMVVDNRWEGKCDEASRKRFREVINKYPRFPFSFYYLAGCLEKEGNLKWRVHYERAQYIFEITTQIAGHNDAHDQALAIVRRKLGT